MSEIERAIAEIEAAAQQLGLPELSRRSQVPYTTLRGLQKQAWRPKSVRLLEHILHVVRSGEVEEAR